MSKAVIMDAEARRVLDLAGWAFVGRKRRAQRAANVARLQEVLNAIYVDNRRQVQIDYLAEARRLAREL